MGNEGIPYKKYFSTIFGVGKMNFLRGNNFTTSFFVVVGL